MMQTAEGTLEATSQYIQGLVMLTPTPAASSSARMLVDAPLKNIAAVGPFAYTAGASE
jgi:hypothetical protein